MNKEELADKIWVLVEKEHLSGLTAAEDSELDSLHKQYSTLVAEEKKTAEDVARMVSREMKQRRGRGRYGEQRLAKKVGGIVVGRSKYIAFPSGKSVKIDCQRPCDVVTEMFAFESKYLQSAPKQIKKWHSQALRNCPSGLIPVLVVGDREEREVYYIMSEHDFLDLHR